MDTTVRVDPARRAVDRRPNRRYYEDKANRLQVVASLQRARKAGVTLLELLDGHG